MIKKVIYVLAFLLMLLKSEYMYGGSDGARELYERGRIEYIKGNYFKALESYREAVRLNVNYKEAKMGLGEVFYSLKSYDKSYTYFKQAEEGFEHDVGIKLWLAKVQIARGRYDSAESYIIRVQNLRPNSYESYMLYGDIEVGRGMGAKGISYYKRASLIDKKDERAYIKMGGVYLSLSQNKQAYKYIKKAHDLNNINPKTILYLGKYYKSEGQLEESEIQIRDALMLKPGYKEGLDELYEVLFLQSKWEAATKVLEELVSHERGAISSSGKIRYYYNLGLLYDKLDKPLKAISYLFEGIEKDGNNEALRYKAEDIYRRYYWKDEEVRKRGSELVSYWHKKGLSYRGQYLTEQAIFAFRRAIRLNPKHIKLRIALSSILKEKGLIDAYYRELKVLIELLNGSKAEGDGVLEEKGFMEKLKDELKDEILFTEYRLENILSKVEEIDQYGTKKTSPKVGLLPFVENKDLKRHYGIEKIYQELLYTALKMEDRLNVILVTEEEINNKDFLEKEGLNFLIRGEIKEDGKNVLRGSGIKPEDAENISGLRVNLKLLNVRDGEIYKRYTLYQSGNDRFLKSALNLGKELAKTFPIFGSIIRLNHKEVYVNVGKRHSYKAGDRFYVLSKEEMLRLIQNKAVEDIIRDKSKLESELLSYKRNKQFGLDIIRLIKTDENISKGRLITSDFFEELSTRSYVIHVP